MRRRAFLYGSAATLAPLFAVEAQQAGKVYRIGYVSLGAQPLKGGMWR
jgi:hypothetical protein